MNFFVPRYAGLKIIFYPPRTPGTAALQREVFIGIFPSSKTVITGAVDWPEVNDAFDFASGLLMHHFEDIRKPIDDAAARRNRPKFR